MDRPISIHEYQSMLFTQLVINGMSSNQAMLIAKEAADTLKRAELPFVSINVG